LIKIILAMLAIAMPAAEAPSVNHKWKVVKPYNQKLVRMAICESNSGGSRPKWHINTGNGYYGGLQFDLSTWRSVGGRGRPDRSSALEQKFRAVKLIKRRGYSPWPHCGYV
jgi:resuscitation-promoting factor RpfA